MNENSLDGTNYSAIFFVVCRHAPVSDVGVW